VAGAVTAGLAGRTTASGMRIALAALRGLPAVWSEEILAGLALGHGLLDPRRRRQALAWARSQPERRESVPRLMLALLAHRGRVLGRQLRVGAHSIESLRERVTVRGREHLDPAGRRSGTLLLGFHLGCGGETLALRSLDSRVVFLGRSWRSGNGRLFPELDPDILLWEDEASRVATLHRVRRMLAEGALVWMTGDGHGQEAFRISLPGRDLVVRAGWHALRRVTGVPTVPVLSHAEGRRLVVVLHPPLPPVAPDPATDVAACRAVLTTLLTAYVRRFPRECSSLALDPGTGEAAAR
jgi:lauroyl/myristoyl acyltransferase